MRSTVRRSTTLPALAALLVLTLALGAALTACGRGDDDPATAPDPEPATVEVQVFFTNDQLGDPCGEVFPVERTVAADDPVRGALTALLAGPTDDERTEGYGGWFSDATAELLLDVEVVDRTAHVTFADLRPVIPNASTSCGSAALLAELDTTLLAFDDIDDTRYALADQTAFYEWLQYADPDAPPPTQQPDPADDPAEGPADDPDSDPEHDQPADETEAAPPDADGDGSITADHGDIPRIDLTGWRYGDIAWSPNEKMCCGVQDIGVPSPPWPDEPFELPDDGWYAAGAVRDPEDPSNVRLSLLRWVSCLDRPDLCTGTEPLEGYEDEGVAVDPDTRIERTVPLADLAVVISHVHGPFPIAGQEEELIGGVYGEPGAFAALLTDVLDPLYERRVLPLLRDGTPGDRIREQLLAEQDDPDHPFADFPLVDHQYDPTATFVGFRGPFGFPIEVTDTFGLPSWVHSGSVRGDDALHRFGRRGLYDLYADDLQVRDGRPILHLVAGTATWG